MISNKGEGIGGMMAITPEQGDAKPAWTVYVSVRDVDATAQQCESMGGEIVIPAHDIPVGRWAMLKDPTGAMFAIYKSNRR
jgi:predicted enzyme related to lactoylglutathione lyase